MNWILDAFSTEPKVFQRFQGEPSLGCPVVTLGGNNTSGDVIGKPVFEDKRRRTLSAELLPVKQLLCQVEVVDEEVIFARNGDSGQRVFGHPRVEDEVNDPFPEVEEGKAAKKGESGRSWRQLLPLSQDENEGGGKKEEK